MESFREQMPHTMLADVLEEDSEVEEMLGGFAESLDSFNKRRHSQPLNSILNKLADKLTFTLQGPLVNLSHKGIHQLLHVDDDLIQQRETVVMVGVNLANYKHHVHGLVDVRDEGVFGVQTEVGGEFTEGLEVRVVVQEV